LESLEDRCVPAIIPTYTVDQDWGSGFQASLRLDNQDPTAVNNWQVSFDYAANISSIWNAQIVSRTGIRYVVRNAGWNANLAAGSAVSFGFVAGPSSSATMSNITVNGTGTGPSLPALSVSDITFNEGNSGTTNATFTVSLSAASTSSVSVQYATRNGTATASSDYTATSGTLTFTPGQISKTVTVSIAGDATVEPDETFFLDLSTPTGATLGRTSATATIRNDDTAPQTGGFTYAVTSNWGSGFNGQVTYRNSTSSAISNWTISFDFSGQISSIWDAQIVSHVGSRYVVKGAGWNDTIAANGSVSFGFTATPGTPTNFALGTGSGGGGGGGGIQNRPPVAVNDSTVAYPAQPTRIAVLVNDSDPDGDVLSVSSITTPANGSATLNSDGTVTYTARAGYVGSDTFSYTISDGRGGTASASVALTVVNPSAAQWPTQYSAPYVDMTLFPTYDLVRTTREQGIKYFTLAFVVAGPGNVPAWGGFGEYAINGSAFDLAMRNQVNGVRALGGDVMVSFGGANGVELAQGITNVTALKNAYRSVVDAYQLTHVDFDIEGAAAADPVSIARRSQAMALLQQELAAEGRALKIWLTLPVLPTGLTQDGVNVVRSAVQAGVNLSGVNIMAMDYGAFAAPNPQGRMGDYAIQAATSLFNQLKNVYGTTKTDAQLWQMVGITPMIGMNDVTTEIFDQQEAREVLAFAQSKGITRLSMWSINRDRANPNGAIGYVETTSSSILQTPFEFSLIFEQIRR
jgi:chitinase